MTSLSKAGPLTPRLVVKGAARALDFYVNALGAELIERYEDEKLGLIVHSALKIGQSILSVVDSAPDWGNTAPADIGGSAVILHLEVDDPDAVAATMERHGATVLIPIEDRFYGHREGRLRDPFGHLWILSRVVEKLPPEEIQRRIDRFHDEE